MGSVPSQHSHQQNAWQLLYSLSLFTRVSYETCQRIRSGEFDTLEVYALYRLAAHMEEPGRSRVRSLISKALQFRNATVPKKNLPFSLPFLAHSDFKQQVQLSLRQVVIRSKELAIPFFLPTHRIREAAHLTLRQFLHNHRKVERRWMTSNIDSLPCCCEELRKMMTCPTSELQHLAVNLEDLRLLAKLKLFQNVHANSTYFAAKPPYFELTIGAFRRWLKHHGLRAELAEDFSQFLSQQWKQHLDELESTPRLSFHLVQHLLRVLPRDLGIR